MTIEKKKKKGLVVIYLFDNTKLFMVIKKNYETVQEICLYIYLFMGQNGHLSISPKTSSKILPF